MQRRFKIMSSQKRLSQISFAAAALLVAALPCLAQTEAGGNRNLTNKGTEIATLLNERLGVRKAEAKTAADAKVARTTNSSVRDKFNETIAQAISSTPVLKSNVTISEADWQKAQRPDAPAESTSAKGITFVPSRGQKLPE
jgi:hypothetical protein